MNLIKKTALEIRNMIELFIRQGWKPDAMVREINEKYHLYSKVKK